MTDFDDATALIVVDIQNDFAHPQGSLYVSGAERVVNAVNRLIEQAQENGSLVCYTQDWHPEQTPHFVTDGGLWPVHCVGDRWGAEFHSDLLLVDGPIVRKGVDGADGYSGFTTRDPQSGEQQSTALEDRLREAGIARCVVVGLATDYCVKETALDAHRLGFETVVVRDAVGAVDLEPGDGERALAELAAAGVAIE